MTDDNQYYRRDPRITFESVVLLVIFMGAALFIAAVVYAIAPWEGDDESANPVVAEKQEAAGAGDDAIVEGGEEATR
jgi:hypothetical protein